MYDGDMAFFDIDDLAMVIMVASAHLDQVCKRGIHDAIQRRVVERTFEANNLEKLKDLVANFKAVIQAHDAKVGSDRHVCAARIHCGGRDVEGH